MKRVSKKVLLATAALAATVGWMPTTGAVVNPSTPLPKAMAAQPPHGVIVELKEPPLAALGSNRAAAAASGIGQRNRVRRAIIDLENQARRARGLSVAASAEIIHREYSVVLNGFAARLSPETVAQLQNDPEVRRVLPDRPVHAMLEVSVPLVRAPEVWNDFGYRGAGTVVAIIDTGVDYNHADLGGCFGPSCKVIGGFDFINNDNDPIDDNGHGTHVAATAAGGGPVPGVAPAAKILAYKVLDATGSGSESSVLAGIERAVDPNNDGNPADHATVINMSLGGGGDEDDMLSTAVDNATSAGVLSVVAAGNSGTYFGIGSPGTARTALTVGATDDNDQIAFFSSRGPTLVHALLKPELTAPGVEICAAAAPGLFIGPPCRDSTHMSISGTSMATPHVTGAAALLRGFDPLLTPEEAKAILQQAAAPLPLDAVTGGAGRLDVREAFGVTTVLTPAPLNLGLDNTSDPTWSQTATVTIRNLSSSSKLYNLSIPDDAFPEGVSVTVTPAAITVGPGSAANVEVTVTVDSASVPNSLLAPPFLYRGALTARAGQEQESISIAFSKQTPMPPPANDTCQQATAISGSQYSDALDVSGATADQSDPQSSCGCGTNRSTVWYSFTAPATGMVSVGTSGSTYDTVLNAYSGSCGNLVPVTCNDDANGSVQSQITFGASAGVTYYILAASYCTFPGQSLHLDFNFDPMSFGDHFTEQFLGGDNDLSNRTLTFTPDGSASFYHLCAGSASAFPTNPAGGTVLSLPDDGAATIDTSAEFYGVAYGNIYVGSNGYLTFSAPDASLSGSLQDHFRLPRIAALFDDLNPSVGGRVSYRQLVDRVAITFENVPRYPSVGANSFQFELFTDGTIRLTYLGLSDPYGLAGLSEGHGVAPAFFETDLSAAGPCQEQMATVSLPSDAEVPEGSSAPVPLTLSASSAAPVEGYYLRVDYDPSVVIATAVQVAPSVPCTAVASIDDPGQVRVAGGCAGGVLGRGPLFNLSFRGVDGACGQSTPLQVARCRLNDGQVVCLRVDGQVTVSCGITGQLRYYSGDTPVPNANVMLRAGSMTIDSTGPNGTYQFPDVPSGNLVIEPTKPQGFGDAVTSLDAVYVLEALAGRRTLNPGQALACDVNGSGDLGTLDAGSILQFSVGRFARFEAGEACDSDWLFAPCPSLLAHQRVIPPQLTGGSCQHGAIALEPYAGSAAGQDFQALLIGDCTGNWQAQGAARLTSAVPASAPEVRFGRLRRSHHGQLALPIVVRANSYQSLDIQLSYDTQRLRLTNVRLANTMLDHGILMESNEVTPGLVAIAVASPEPLRSHRVVVVEFENRRTGPMFGGIQPLRALIDEAHATMMMPNARTH